MRKLSTLVLLALLAVPLMNATSAAPGPEPTGPELVTICYYGVTMKVAPKIAARYINIGATYNACGEQGGQETR